MPIDRDKLAREMTHWESTRYDRPYLNTAQAMGMLNVPVASDVSGLLGDLQMYRDRPEERGLLNYALTGAGALPFIPALAGIVRNPMMENAAKRFFGITRSPREAGYVMDNGALLDFSGRHQVGDYVQQRNLSWAPKPGIRDWMSGKRDVDHREVYDVVGRGGWEGMQEFMDQTGAIRYGGPNGGIEILHDNMPSRKQIETIVKDFRGRGQPLIVDVSHHGRGDVIATMQFDRPTVDEVMEFLGYTQRPTE